MCLKVTKFSGALLVRILQASSREVISMTQSRTSGKGWFPYFRFCAASEAYYDKSWQLKDIELVK
jgi:hypothetical protein